MRIDRLDLIAFGPFTDTTLDLAAGAEGLHIVYGPNEAGKTSALRAIKQFFRGIPHQSSDDFVHDYRALAIGALLRCRDGSTLDLVRRKGARNTLLNRDRTPADGGESLLARAIGGLSPDDFARRFLIDRDELVAGGKELVAGKGDLGQALFSASGSLVRVSAAQKALDEEARELFLPTGSRPVINARLAELVELKKKVREAELPSSKWVQEDQDLRARQARGAELDRDLDEARRQRGQWARLADAIEPAARRREILAALDALGPVPPLSDGFLQRYHETNARLPTLEHDAAEAHRRAVERTEQIETLDVPEAILDEAEAIEELRTRLGRSLQAESDRIAREAELAQVETDLRAALLELGHDPASLADGRDDEGPLRNLRLTAATRAAVLELANDRANRLRDRDDARRALDEANVRRRRNDEARALLGPVVDPAPLRKTARKAQAVGDVDTQIETARAEQRAAERQVQTALRRLGRWTGPPDAAPSLPGPPARPDLGRQAERPARARADESLDRALLQTERDLAALNARLHELALQGDVPSEESLAQARLRRDDAWHALAAARPWNEAFATAFLDAQRQADEQADRLRREADRVATRAHLVADRARLDTERQIQTQARGRVDTAREQGQAGWIALWAPAGLSDVGSPREMKAWLRGLTDLVTLVEAVAARRSHVETLEQTRAAHLAALAAALRDAGQAAAEEESDDEEESLADRLERVLEAEQRARSQAEERKRLNRQRADDDAGRPDLERALESAEAAWNHWRERWAEAVGPLGLDRDATPTAAGAAVERATALFQALDRRRALRLEIEAATREASRFAVDVRALAARVAPALLPDPNALIDVHAIAATLADRLKSARHAHQERAHQYHLRDEAITLERKLRGEIQQLHDNLAALRLESGCDRDDAIPEVARRAQAHATLTEELGHVDTTLRTLAANTPLDAFLTEVAGADADAIAPRLARLDERIANLQAGLNAVNQAIGAGRERLERMSGGADAAELRQQEEDLRAQIKNHAEQYVRIRLAASVLRAGIDRYRQKAQDPVLARAGETFARLTLGSFQGLTVDYDDGDAPVLKGVRPDGAHVSITPGMSLGTTDQLYLSLRLATLEATLDRGTEPLPLIVDDVLIQFDDDRAGATLDVLAEFSRRAQVLLFTHHAHLVRLATARLPADVALVHELSPTRAPARSRS